MPEVTEPVFAIELFRTYTRATPEHVWEVLTATGSSVGFPFGMTVESDWQPGSTVTITVTSEWRLTGEVLAVDRPNLLCYTLGDRPGEPCVYVKWELRAMHGLTFIRLYVDDPWSQSSVDWLEAAWLPVLSGLVAHLDRIVAPHHEHEA
jgi:hypothetical protein